VRGARILAASAGDSPGPVPGPVRGARILAASAGDSPGPVAAPARGERELPASAGDSSGPAAAPALGERRGALDAFARLHWDAGGWLGSYRACGAAGFVAGLGLVLALGRITGASRVAVAAVVITVPVSFLLAVRLSRAIFGYERIVFFEKALIALGTTALALLALGQDVLAGLDLATLGIGTFLGLGRVGCLMVGCCHGRPSRWGIRYGADHGRAGLSWYLVGRRLFPIQLVDGLVSLVLVGAGVLATQSPHAPGAITAGWLVGYSAARFVEEMFRGDAARPCLLGLSEAQWTAALLAVVIATAGLGDGGAMAVAAILAASALALVLARRRLARTAWGLTSPWHLDEVHRALQRLDHNPGPVRTSQGLCISLRVIERPSLRDYVLSFPDRPLPWRTATTLADHVRFQRTPGEHVALRPGATPGLVHVLVSEGPRP
jgi:hypothetical protein